MLYATLSPVPGEGGLEPKFKKPQTKKVNRLQNLGWLYEIFYMD